MYKLLLGFLILIFFYPYNTIACACIGAEIIPQFMIDTGLISLGLVFFYFIVFKIFKKLGFEKFRTEFNIFNFLFILVIILVFINILINYKYSIDF